MGQISFYLIRLKKASFGELVHRSREALFIRRLAKNPKSFLSSLHPIPEARLDGLHLPQWIETGDRLDPEMILAGQVAPCGIEKRQIEEFEERFRGSLFMKVSASKEDPDIRAVWEIGRLQHLTHLLHEIRQEPESEQAVEIKNFVREKLLSWLSLNHMPLRSALYVGYGMRPQNSGFHRGAEDSGQFDRKRAQVHFKGDL